MALFSGKRTTFLLFLLLAVASCTGLAVLTTSASEDDDRALAMAATVQITAVTSPPDYNAPWQRRPTASVTGSGVIIDGSHVLTNAHVVAQAVSIELRRLGLPEQYPARVAYIDHGSDLALLVVEDPKFCATARVPQLGGMPRLESRVNVYGYPLGAQMVCSTEGVVSRVEYDLYTHGYRYLLTAQLDAPINPGSSGGPAFVDGKIVGLAMQKPEDTEGSGQFIPAPVIARFLADTSDGVVEGAPSLGLSCQPLESQAMRESLGMTAEQTGVYVTAVASTGSCGSRLRCGDVILSIDDLPIANDGTISLGQDQRIDWAWPANQKQVGDVLRLGVLRDSALNQIDIVLKSRGQILACPAYPEHAPYRIFGGLVFQPVDLDLALSQGEDVPINTLALYTDDALQTEDRREVVTLGRILPHPVNRGYQDWGGELVVAVQGEPVRDFAGFNELLDNASGKWISITLDDASVVVMDLAKARDSLSEILSTYNAPSDRFPGAQATRDVITALTQ